jgi:hypothetical protein
MLTLNQGGVAALAAAIGRRELQPRDGAVYLALLSFMNPITCRVDVRARVVAERVGMMEKHVISSISRLCKAHHVARQRGPGGDPVLVLNPWVGPQGHHSLVAEDVD